MRQVGERCVQKHSGENEFSSRCVCWCINDSDWLECEVRGDRVAGLHHRELHRTAKMTAVPPGSCEESLWGMGRVTSTYWVISLPLSGPGFPVQGSSGLALLQGLCVCLPLPCLPSPAGCLAWSHSSLGRNEGWTNCPLPPHPGQRWFPNICLLK